MACGQQSKGALGTRPASDGVSGRGKCRDSTTSPRQSGTRSPYFANRDDAATASFDVTFDWYRRKIDGSGAPLSQLLAAYTCIGIILAQELLTAVEKFHRAYPYDGPSAEDISSPESLHGAAAENQARRSQ